MSILKRGLFIFKSYVSPILDRYEDAMKKGSSDSELRRKSFEELDREYEARKRRQKRGKKYAGRRRRNAPTRDGNLAQCYANLDLPFGADLQQVKKAWRRLMKKFHPDRFINDNKKRKIATELAQKITRSYEILEKHLLAKKKGKTT